MSKSDQNKTNVLNNFGKKIVDLTNKYDVEKKISAQDKYKLYKQVANNQGKKEFRDIERKYKKKSSIAQRTVPSETVSVGKLPLNLFDYNFQKNFYTHQIFQLIFLQMLKILLLRLHSQQPFHQRNFLIPHNLLVHMKLLKGKREVF